MIYVIVHVGYFKKVEITTLPQSPVFYLVYKEHTGAYFKINETIQFVEKELNKVNINCRVSFGHYLDNPEVVEEERLKSHGGCTLQQPMSESKVKSFGLRYKEIKDKKFVKANFSGSPALGPIKVYPEVKDYMSKNRMPFPDRVLEIYTQQGKEFKTEFFFEY